MTRAVYETRPPQTWVEFYRQLEKALKGEEAPLAVTAEQACDVLKLVDLIEESSATGRAFAVQPTGRS